MADMLSSHYIYYIDSKNPSTFVYPINWKLIHKYIFETDISMLCYILSKWIIKFAN